MKARGVRTRREPHTEGVVAVSWLHFSPSSEFFAGSLGFGLKMKSVSTKQDGHKVFSQHASACGTAFPWSPAEMGLKVLSFQAEIIPRKGPSLLSRDKAKLESAAQPSSFTFQVCPFLVALGLSFFVCKMP